MNPHPARVLARFALLVMGALPLLARSAEPALPVWEIGVLGGAAFTPASPGSNDRSSRKIALPFLVYRGKVLRSDRSGIGVRLLRTEAAEADVAFALALPARSDHATARAGMPDLGPLVEFGPRLKLKLADQVRLELPLRAAMEVRGGVRHQGWTFEPRLIWTWRPPADPWTVDASLGLVAGDSAINRYFYEVEPRYATPVRPAYSARSGLMLTRVGLGGSRKLTPDVRVYGFLRRDSYAGAANRDSPLMKRGTGISVGAGFAWTLGRSTRMTGDER